jgi:CRP/FNR family cyclic AMP-dependent transcriptional regulator
MSTDIRRQAYTKDQIIFKEGAAPGEVYLIKSGAVEISKQGAEGKIVLATLGKNEIFGEMALIDQQPRSASARAIEPTECFVLTKLIFEEKLKQTDPFIRGIFRVMSSTIRRLGEEKAAGQK